MGKETQLQSAAAPQYYGVKEIAAIFSLSKATVSQAIKQGKIPCIRVSHFPFVPREWVEQQHEVATASLGGVK